ncbi:hypothetical protein A2U01_0081630, partial [Trifolium medium]|nr:hypothetical protein [Trifolium medium]
MSDVGLEAVVMRAVGLKLGMGGCDSFLLGKDLW